MHSPPIGKQVSEKIFCIHVAVRALRLAALFAFMVSREEHTSAE